MSVNTTRTLFGKKLPLHCRKVSFSANRSKKISPGAGRKLIIPKFTKQPVWLRRTALSVRRLLLLLSFFSLFVGVLDISPAGLFGGDLEQLEIFLISRLPRLLAILCTETGMSVAGLIMQQLCMNKFVLFMGLTIAAAITASVVVVVGSISYIGLIIPNVVAMFKGDKIRGTLIDTALLGALFVLVCDMIARVVIAPYELPIELIVGIIGSILFIGILFRRLKHGRKAVRSFRFKKGGAGV